MTRPHAPSGISPVSLREAIQHAALLGLPRSAYEAWVEYAMLLGPSGTTEAEPELTPAANLSAIGMALIVREPLAIGTKVILRLVRPDASTGNEQCAFVWAIEPGHDTRWWRCAVRFIHPDDPTA